MLEAEGVIVKIGQEGVFVETSRASACGSCSSKSGCGTSTLSQILGSKPTTFKVLDPIGAALGERVVIGMEEAALLKSSLLAYLVPLVFLMAGAILGGWLAPANLKDAYALGGVVVGLVLGFVVLKWINASAGTQRQFQPVILRRAFSQNFVTFTGGREG
jgi:sigma-E factor negative regulatory protein RseC